MEKIQSTDLSKVKALIVYTTYTGHTEMIASAIARGMESQGLKPKIKRIEEIEGDELLDYDFICLGSPTRFMLPAPAIDKYFRTKYRELTQRNIIVPGMPLLPGKYGAVWCSCTGVHDGLGEGMPCVEWLRSCLEHLGHDVRAKWIVLGEFEDPVDKEKNLRYSTQGRFGDVRGRPNERDLVNMEENAATLIRQLRFVLGKR
jgi:flavodoxin